MKVVYYVADSKNTTITVATDITDLQDKVANGIRIINDAAAEADLTVTINGITYTVKQNEDITLEFLPFIDVEITSTVAFRCWILVK